jgi:hypothetical protein
MRQSAWFTLGEAGFVAREAFAQAVTTAPPVAGAAADARRLLARYWAALALRPAKPNPAELASAVAARDPATSVLVALDGVDAALARRVRLALARDGVAVTAFEDYRHREPHSAWLPLFVSDTADKDDPIRLGWSDFSEEGWLGGGLIAGPPFAKSVAEETESWVGDAQDADCLIRLPGRDTQHRALIDTLVNAAGPDAFIDAQIARGRSPCFYRALGQAGPPLTGEALADALDRALGRQ